MHAAAPLRAGRVEAGGRGAAVLLALTLLFAVALPRCAVSEQPAAEQHVNVTEELLAWARELGAEVSAAASQRLPRPGLISNREIA